MVDGFGNHIFDFGLIADGREMEAAHAENRTLQTGLAQRTLWSLEIAKGRFVLRFGWSGDLGSWNHGRNPCQCGTFQEASAADIKFRSGMLLHDGGFP